MTTPFVASLRARPETIRLADGVQPTITLRVQMPDVWDAVRIETTPAESVVAVKRAALDALYPDHEFHEDFVLKLKGYEVLDEATTLGDVGAVNGSIFLITHRRRRPVR